MKEVTSAGHACEESVRDKKQEQEYYCPLMWEGRLLKEKNPNGLYTKRCIELGRGLSIAEHCKYYSDKASCWAIYEGNQKV